jgi:hypothetical protein
MSLPGQETTKVIDVVVPATHCYYTFSDQSIIEPGVKLWTFGRFSPGAAIE